MVLHGMCCKRHLAIAQTPLCTEHIRFVAVGAHAIFAPREAKSVVAGSLVERVPWLAKVFGGDYVLLVSTE